MEQKLNTRALVEIALMSALIVIITIVSGYFGLFQILVSIAIPVIVAIVYKRSDFKGAVLCVVVSTILSCILTGPVFGIILTLNYGLFGVALGYFILSGKSQNKIMMYSMIAVIVLMVMGIVVTGFFSGIYNPFKYFYQFLNEEYNLLCSSIDQVNSIVQGMDNAKEVADMYEQMKALFSVENMLMIMPSFLVGVSFILSYIYIEIFRIFDLRLNRNTSVNIELSNVYVSNIIGAALIATTSIGIILVSKGVSWGQYIYGVSRSLMIVVLYINGFCAVDYYLKKKMMVPRGFRALIIIVTFLLTAGMLYSIVGFGEMILDFRKLDPYRLRKA